MVNMNVESKTACSAATKRERMKMWLLETCVVNRMISSLTSKDKPSSQDFAALNSQLSQLDEKIGNLEVARTY